MGAHRLLAALRQSSLVRNVLTVATGIAAAQVISLAFAPFLTRLFDPEAFGVLAAFVAMMTILNPIATLGFSTAIVLPPTSEGATNVARLCMVSAAISALVTLIWIWIFEAQLANWTGFEAAPHFLYLVPLSLVSTALLAVAEHMAIRESQFKAQAVSKVTSTLLINCAKLLAGLLAPSGLALVVITEAGKLLNFLMLLARVPRQGGFLVRQWFGTAGVREAAAEHQDFVLYRLPQSMINAASLGLPVLLLTALFGAATAGQYSLTTLVLGAPVMLLGKSVMDVFYPRITREIANGQQNAARLMWKATKVSSLLSVGLFGPLTLVSPYLFPLVFGASWVEAGLFAQWISIWMIGVAASRPCVAAFPALGLQKKLLFYELIVTGARIAALYFGAHYWNALTAVAVFAVINLVGYTALIALAMHRARRE